ncbi:unnamed protein product [Durusdinium trenchii]
MSSAIIGPKGNNARAIREESACKVVIDSNVTSGHQQVKLIGEPRGLHLALQMVNRHIQDQFGTPGYTDWSTIKSFDRSGNPIHCSPGELNFGRADVRHDARGYDAHEERERERTPRGPAAPAPGPRGRVAIPPPSSLTTVTAPDRGEVDSSLLTALVDTARTFPAGALEAEYTITCELPSDKVGLLIGKRGEDVQRIRKATGTYVHFDPVQDGADGQTLTIRGPMLKVYRAHALLMRRYHETTADVVQDTSPAVVPDRKEEQRVQDLEAQLQQLQRQMEEVKQMRSSTGPPTMAPRAKGPGKGRKGR